MSKVPQHIGVIMDGNGRWANKRSHRRIWGHVRGASKVKPLVKECDALGVKALTLYAFSSENWARPKDEVSSLLKLLKKYLIKEVPELKKDNVQFRVIGDRSVWPNETREVVEWAEEMLMSCDGFQLTFAFSYGSKQELVFAFKKIQKKIKDDLLSPDEIDEKIIDDHLMTRGLPELDLLIRTGGEQRLSNFMLWQAAYAEFVFFNVAWPEFTKVHLHNAIELFNSRERRYGMTGSQVSKEPRVSL